MFFLYDTSVTIDLMFALATNYTVKTTTIIELSLSRFFKRQYSSLLLAIRRYCASRQNKEGRIAERIKVRNRIRKFLSKLVIKGDNECFQ